MVHSPYQQPLTTGETEATKVSTGWTETAHISERRCVPVQEGILKLGVHKIHASGLTLVCLQ